MEILNALDIKNGRTVEKMNIVNSHVQPSQMLPSSEKDESWQRWNMDWLENIGLAQLRARSVRLAKNYKLAVGRIDKSDYIVGQENEFGELVDYLTKEDESALEIKFYPIIPQVINVLMGEFSKRTNKQIVKATDQFSKNELLEKKKDMVQQRLLAEAREQLMLKLAEQGIDGDTDEEKQMIQEQMESIKSLPEVENYMRKSYQGIVEEWANHQLAADEERFKMYELESIGFYDMLVTGTEFWHIAMREDDYEVEIWNPLNTFFQKSSDVRYVSQGNYAGNIQLMSPADIIDKFGYMMTEAQVLSLESNHANINSGLLSDGREFTDLYDTSIPHNKQVPGVNAWGKKEVAHAQYRGELGGEDLLHSLSNTSADQFERQGFIRVTQAYWKSQVKMFLRTVVNELGEKSTDWVGENYVVREKPIYDLTSNPNKTRDNLIFGEHIDVLWPNQTWRGIKIGSSYSGLYGRTSNNSGPIYLAVEPLPFQLKGDYTVWGCRLPVEGAVFNDRNAPITSIVDLMKSNQVGFNIVNNQMADMLIDELGSILVLDQNTLPKHSLGEEWGKGNLSKAYIAMKNFQMLPLDHSVDNTEERINYNQSTVLNMSQTERLIGRIQLAEYFKNAAFETIGITPQRLGEVTASESATGTQQAVNNSYAQTEMWFIRHMNFLMPRVKEAILNVAQYYHSNKPSIRLQYLTNKEENAFFEMEGTKLLARDFGVFCSQKPDSRAILEQLKQLATQMNSSGASLYDLARIIQSDSPSEVISIVKAGEMRAQQMREQEMNSEQQLQQQQAEAEMQKLQMEQQFDAEENQKDRDANIAIAEIRASMSASFKDSDDDGLAFSKQVADDYHRTKDLGFKERAQSSKESIEREKMNLKREEMASKERIENTKLKVAKENQTQAELTKRKQIAARPKPKSKK